MMSTSAELQKLNAKVYSKDFKPSGNPNPDCDKVGKKAGAKALKVPPGAASLMLHKPHREQGSLVIHPQIVDRSRVQAQALKVQKEHRRELADDEEDVKVLTSDMKEAESTAISLAGALRGAEQQDQSLPPRQPAKAQMLLPKAEAKKPTRRVSFSVSMPKAHKSDEDDEGDDEGEDSITDDESSSIPQSADAFERQEEEEDERPSMSALQQHGDADGEEEDTMSDSSDDDEVQEDEDVSSE